MLYLSLHLVLSLHLYVATKTTRSTEFHPAHINHILNAVWLLYVVFVPKSVGAIVAAVFVTGGSMALLVTVISSLIIPFNHSFWLLILKIFFLLLLCKALCQSALWSAHPWQRPSFISQFFQFFSSMASHSTSFSSLLFTCHLLPFLKILFTNMFFMWFKFACTCGLLSFQRDLLQSMWKNSGCKDLMNKWKSAVWES